jgi:uncharacterized phage protein (TIGR01671 family)
MNKIKYRAWNNETNTYKNNVFLSDDGLNLMYFEDAKIFVSPLLTETYTIEQYSGFDDKSGVPIFENDIINLKYHYADGTDDIEDVTKKVIFNNGSFSFDNGTMLEFKLKPFSSMEVIGNINQNPQLLN